MKPFFLSLFLLLTFNAHSMVCSELLRRDVEVGDIVYPAYSVSSIRAGEVISFNYETDQAFIQDLAPGKSHFSQTVHFSHLSLERVVSTSGLEKGDKVRIRKSPDHSMEEGFVVGVNPTNDKITVKNSDSFSRSTFRDFSIDQLIYGVK